LTKLNQIHFFEELKDSSNIILAGAGGGFDIFSGLPLYFSLKEQGKNVILANFSFTWLNETNSEQVFPFCYLVKSTDRDFSGRNYFPEKFLCEWFLTQEENIEIYAFDKTGVNPLKKAYNYIIKKHNIDTIILVDGGTDSLMFGDEEGLGTPEEDICSMAAVYRSSIKKTFLVSIGFGIDHYHGVSHYHFLENISELIRDGGYLGLFSVTKEMEEGQKLVSAIKYVNMRMKGKESIVTNSISSAIEGYYGNHQMTKRTQESELWINPLMSIYWCFTLSSIINKNKYYDRIKSTNSMSEIKGELAKFRGEMTEYREKKRIPL
jgi:hypothetical protein